jgi:hypothetical protein
MGRRRVKGQWILGLPVALAAWTAMPGHAAAQAYAWSIVPSPNSSSTDQDSLQSVACASPTDCWAVGYLLNNHLVFQTLIEHWDGSVWTLAASPDTSILLSNFLLGVACPSPSECWAVGEQIVHAGSDETQFSQGEPLIERWDGSSWTIFSSAPVQTTGATLTGASCTSVDDCWAAGYSGVVSLGPDVPRPAPDQTFTVHWDGSSWTVVPSPNADNSQSGFNVFSGVTCETASECWAVGNDADPSQTLVEQWDGSAWYIVASPSPSSSNFLSGVACSAATACVAVGETSGSGPILERFDGALWAVAPETDTPSADDALLGAACDSASQCVAVGLSLPSSGADQTVIYQWDGLAWAAVASPDTSTTNNNQLNGVACSQPSTCWAVGSADGDTAEQTLIEVSSASPGAQVPEVPLVFLLPAFVLLGVGVRRICVRHQRYGAGLVI